MAICLTRSLIDEATKPSIWDLGNKVLYDLCRKNPKHTNADAVFAKIWLIGRAYAAAIERRRNRATNNDEFYTTTVVPEICKSEIDQWLENLRGVKAINSKSFQRILQVHGKVTKLFAHISGLEKRSLASKYLHFHQRKLFYIYDSRAVGAMGKLGDVVKQRWAPIEYTDNEYCRFAANCESLRKVVEDKHSISLTPRQMDNLLLLINP
ncbi:MAG: hypothetical protein JSR34_08560 [Proteobacteria bacterium]|nr:hypothetical protein [Pseudomonadota bacterium]